MARHSKKGRGVSSIGSLKSAAKHVPKEFTIAPGQWPADFVEVIKALTNSVKTQAEDPTTTKRRERFLAGLATELWRLKQKLIKPGTDEPIDEVRRAFRHLKSMWDLLIQEEVEIKDPTNEPFNSGMMLNVIAYESSPEFTRETVIETLKPAVFYKREPIQIADVVVGKPAN